MRRTTGFTLVEMLIALAVFSTLAVAFAGAFRQAVHCWKTQKEDMRRRQIAWTVMDRLARDLRNAVPFAEGNLVASESEMTFYKAEKKRIFRVTYRVAPRQDGVEELICIRQPLSFGADVTPARETLWALPAAIRWEFAQLSPGNILWKRDWRGTDGFPLSVRVRFASSPASGSQAPEVYQRVLDLPLGGRK